MGDAAGPQAFFQMGDAGTKPRESYLQLCPATTAFCKAFLHPCRFQQGKNSAGTLLTAASRLSVSYAPGAYSFVT